MDTTTTRLKFDQLNEDTKINEITMAIIHHYAILDNKNQIIDILTKNSFEFEEGDICMYVFKIFSWI